MITIDHYGAMNNPIVLSSLAEKKDEEKESSSAWKVVPWLSGNQLALVRGQNSWK